MDHLLDTVATPAAFIAGTIVAASFAPEMNPVVQWTLALIAGGGTAGLTVPQSITRTYYTGY